MGGLGSSSVPTVGKLRGVVGPVEVSRVALSLGTPVHQSLGAGRYRGCPLDLARGGLGALPGWTHALVQKNSGPVSGHGRRGQSCSHLPSSGKCLAILAEIFCRTTVCLFTTFLDLFLFLFLHVLKSFHFFADKV